MATARLEPGGTGGRRQRRGAKGAGGVVEAEVRAAAMANGAATSVAQGTKCGAGDE